MPSCVVRWCKTHSRLTCPGLTLHSNSNMLRLVVGLLLVTALSQGLKLRREQSKIPKVPTKTAAETPAQNAAVATAPTTTANSAETATANTAQAATASTPQTATESGSANATTASIDYASLLYVQYLEQHPTPGVLSLSSGAPIKYRDAYVSINRNMLLNENLMEGLFHIVAETIPAKVNHEKGAGAGGYFEVTHDITNICKAKLFNEIGKRTPIRVRFSNGFNPVDTARDLRGFAVKFYTEDGNFDIPGLGMPVFFFNDPTKFTSVLHVVKNNPVSGMPDPNSLFDYAISNEEIFLMISIFFTDTGTPASYRTMPGYSQHAYQVSNVNNDISFVRFHFQPYNETKLTATQAAAIAGQDIDYLTRDLYNGIAAGNYPEWVVGIQVLTLDEVLNEPRLMDISRYLPEDRFPVQPVGKFVLNKNPDNYFAEMGQIQFLPSSLVPGIQAPPDKIFQSRAYAYRLSGNHRLGVNFNKIPVNQPLTKPMTYNKDGPPPVLDNEGATPTYFPNSFNGPQPIPDGEPETISIVELPAYNRDQIDEYYRNLPEDQKTALTQNMAAAAVRSAKFIQERLIKLITEFNQDYGTRLAAEMKRLTEASQ